MIDIAWLIPALPLAAFLMILGAGRVLGEPKAGYLATTALGASFLVSVGVFFDMISRDGDDRTHVVKVFTWLPVGSLHVDMAFLVDPLSMSMCLFVTGVGTLIFM